MEKLKKPTSQTQEVLYELINNPKGLTRLELTTYLVVLNVPQVIRKLRLKGVDIFTKTIHTTNKNKRKTKYGKYILTDHKKAKEIYNQLT